MDWNDFVKLIDISPVLEKVSELLTPEEYQTRNELSVRSTYLEAILKSLDSSAIVSITNKDGVILQVNEAFCRVSQYSEEELIGKRHNVVNSGYHPSEFWKEMWETVLAGKHWRSEVKNQAKDGSFYWVDTSINPILDQKGEIVQFLSIRNLITDKKNLEIALENESNLLRKTIAILQEEISFAETVQNNLFPRVCHFLNGRIHIHSYFRALETVSGDIYDYSELSTDVMRIFIADATGHGIRAGFQTMSIQTEYQRMKSLSKTPGRILEVLNQSIRSVFPNLPIHYTGMVLDIHVTDRTISYSSAGHPDGILIQGEELTFLNPLSPLIGLRESSCFPEQKLSYSPGSRLLLYTDGVLETYNNKLEAFGTKRFLEFAKKNQNIEAESFLRLLEAELLDFSESRGFHDDLTILAIDL